MAPTVWTEAEEVPATCTEVTGQLAYELAKGVDWGTDSKAVTGTSDGYGLGSLGGVSDL